MSNEENIFRPSTTRRAVTASGLPLGHYFSTSREMKTFIEDSDRFIEECLLEKARNGSQVQEPDINLEQEPTRQPSKSNQRSHKRRKPRHN